MVEGSTEGRDTGRARGRTRARWRFAFLAFCIFVLVGFAFRRPLLVATAALLDVGEAPVAADLILLLGGAIDSRPLVAADVYRQGFAPRILLTRVADTQASRLGVMPNETDATREILMLNGVPDSAVIVLRTRGGAASTTDEAKVLSSYLERNPADRVLVVTSTYHTRRARWNLERQLEENGVEIRMIPAADPRFAEDNWWRTEAGLLAYTEEYLKFLHNWIYR